MDGGFFVDGHGRQFEYNEETGRAWGQDDDQYSWLEGEDQWDDFCSFTKLWFKRGDYRNYYDDELGNSNKRCLGGYKF